MSGDSALRQAINEVKRRVVELMKYKIEHNEQNRFDWNLLYKETLTQNVGIGIEPYDNDIRNKVRDELLNEGIIKHEGFGFYRLQKPDRYQN